MEKVHVLDKDEAFRLALHASNDGDRYRAISLLRSLLDIEPRHSDAIYLLSVQHAELGLYQKAIEGLLNALSINPNMDLARFQLTLLLLNDNNHTEAKSQLKQLLISEDIAISAFSEGLLAFLEKNLMVAQEKISFGISKCSNNLALSNIMNQFLKSLDSTANRTEDRSFIGAYQQAL